MNGWIDGVRKTEKHTNCDECADNNVQTSLHLQPQRESCTSLLPSNGLHVCTIKQ